VLLTYGVFRLSIVYRNISMFEKATARDAMIERISTECSLVG